MQALLLEILLIFPQILTSGNMGGLIPFVFTEFVSNMTFYAIASIVGIFTRIDTCTDVRARARANTRSNTCTNSSACAHTHTHTGYSCFSNLMGELPCKIPVISTAVFQQIGGGYGFED